MFSRPAPRVYWKKVKANLPIGRLENRYHGTLLKINEVKWQDEGDYVCTGLNAKGFSTYTINVEVQGEKVILITTVFDLIYLFSILFCNNFAIIGF